MAYRLFKDEKYRRLCDRGVEYLMNHHVDTEYGGMCWVMHANGSVVDGAKWMYSNAFSLLALSEAIKIGVGTGTQKMEMYIDQVWQVLRIHVFTIVTPFVVYNC